MINRTQLSNALTGTITIGAPFTDADQRKRRLNRPVIFTADPHLLANLAILDREEHEEGPVRGIRPATLTGQLDALVSHIVRDAISRQEFFAAAKRIDHGKKFDVRDLIILYDAAIGAPPGHFALEADRVAGEIAAIRSSSALLGIIRRG